MPETPKLLDQVRELLRFERQACRTEETYVNRIRRFILFHSKRHPRDMGMPEVRAQKPKRLPTVLTKPEVQRALAQLTGMHVLMTRLLYGSGLRLAECVRLRVKDVDFELHQITVRDSKATHNRVTMLPESVIPALQDQLTHGRALHAQDLAQGYGCVYLPDALERKYPNASTEWSWQYVFPASRLSTDPRTGAVHRHHIHEGGLQKAVRKAALKAGIDKRITCHTFRHCSATRLLEAGYEFRTLQNFRGIGILEQR